MRHFPQEEVDKLSPSFPSAVTSVTLTTVHPERGCCSVPASFETGSAVWPGPVKVCITVARSARTGVRSVST